MYSNFAGLFCRGLHTDPKFGRYQEVKVLQTRLADHKQVLNDFIISKEKFTYILNKNCT